MVFLIPSSFFITESNKTIGIKGVLLMKGFKLSKLWYYIISFTWGVSLSLIGAICGLALYVIGFRPEKNIYGWVFRIGENWGGVNLGVVSIVSKRAGQHTLLHEFGHSIQLCIFGPFIYPFVVIPSVTRYWFRRYQESKGITDLPDYDYAWFEGMATMFGKRYQDLH